MLSADCTAVWHSVFLASREARLGGKAGRGEALPAPAALLSRHRFTVGAAVLGGQSPVQIKG